MATETLHIHHCSRAIHWLSQNWWIKNDGKPGTIEKSVQLDAYHSYGQFFALSPCHETLFEQW